HEGVDGSSRFLKRVWAFGWQSHVRLSAVSQTGEYRLAADVAKTDAGALRREIHTVLKQASFDMERKQFNTVASAAMKLLNALQDAGNKFGATPNDVQAQALHEGFGILLRVLYPMTPHIAHALWSTLGYAGDIVDAAWPEVDDKALASDEIELVVQVNGKLRGHLVVPKSADKAQIEQLALASEVVQKHTQGQPPKKLVVVPGRLVNIVV